MRLLIAKLASASPQSVSVALNSPADVADLATDLETAAHLLRAESYDLVLILVSAGQPNARDAIATLRRHAEHMPMVMLTEPALADGTPDPCASRSAKFSRSEAGEAAGMHGAVGWHVSDPEMPSFRDAANRIALDTEQETLRVDGQPVGLSQAEFRIFARLWEQRGRIVTAEDLMEAIYGTAERPASRVLPVFLFKLRKKLSGFGLGDLIETAIGRGFTVRDGGESEIQG